MTIEEINKRFDDLMNELANINQTLNQLDAVRIQLVYNYTAPDPETREPNEDNLIKIDITPFITECLSKLSVYHGVYCNLGAAYCFEFNGVIINNGDFLIKQPNNTFLRIPGSIPYYYQPTSYTDSGQLIFSLTSSTSQPEVPIAVPQWKYGHPAGRIFAAHSISPTNSITLPCAQVSASEVYGGRYFVLNSNNVEEEIVFSPSHLVVNINQGTVTFPTNIVGYYIPYIQKTE